jgi:type I restriction enzyme, S subunit
MVTRWAVEMSKPVERALEAPVRRFRTYPCYKISGAEWLGNIPSHWKSLRLKYGAPISNSRGSGKLSITRYIALENIESGTGRLLGTGSEPSEETALACFRRGDVLFGKLRPYLAKVLKIDFDGICSTELIVLRSSVGLLPAFLAYQLVSPQFINWVDAMTYGTKMPRLSPEHLEVQSIAVPPAGEQLIITEFLDSATARIDALIGEKEQLLDLLQEKRISLITQAVTRGIDPDALMKNSGVGWLGSVPAHWNVGSVKRAARKGYKTFTDGDWIEIPYITNDGVRLIQTGNIGIGHYKEQGFRYISEDTVTTLRCTEVFPRDVLICRLDGPVGRACLAPDIGVRMVTSVDNTILKIDPTRNDPRFLVYVFSSRAWLDWIESICRVGGGFRFRVSRSMLGDQALALPPLQEQQIIADALDLESERIRLLEAEISRGITVQRELRSALISAAVTGKIDVRGEAA